MNPRSFLNLILKLIGIFFLIDVLDALSRTVSVLVYFSQYPSRQEAMTNLAVTLPHLVLYTVFVSLLLFGSNFLIRIFRLDKGMNDQLFPVRLHRSVILSIGIIAGGGWMLVSGLPEFIRQIVYYWQERKMYVRMAHPDISYVAMSFVKLVLGLLLIGFHKPIVNLIEAKRRNQGSWYWPARIPFIRRRKKVV